jgi:hypothetical protein
MEVSLVSIEKSATILGPTHEGIHRSGSIRDSNHWVAGVVRNHLGYQRTFEPDILERLHHRIEVNVTFAKITEAFGCSDGSLVIFDMDCYKMVS